MDINILLVLQDFRNGVGSIFTSFLTKMSLIGEMEVVLVIIALIYWCASKSFGTYLLMGWSGNRVVNGLLKVTACVYRPWIRDVRIVPDSAAQAAATGYSFPSGHSMNAASLYGGGAIRKELPRVLRSVLAIIFVLIAFSRIFLGVHTPQDILIGSATGLLVMWLTMRLMKRIENSPQMDIPVMCVAIAVAIAVAVFAAVKAYPEDYDSAGKLIVDGAKMAKDTYKGVGWCIGVFAGWVLERRYIGFSTDIHIINRMTRIVTGLFSYYTVTLILKEILNKNFSTVVATILITFVQTFYVTFVFPWCIKRWNNRINNSKTIMMLSQIILSVLIFTAITGCGQSAQTPTKQESFSIESRDGFYISEISDDLFARMKSGNTFKDDCIVPREDLRYLIVLHVDMEGNTHQGEMVVHKLIAKDVLEIFEKLYDAGYPIERMVLPDNYMADDEIMMRDNNSSSFNFRFISHTDKISKHGLGMAVDINTLYNPYHKFVKNDDGSTTEIIEPATGEPYLDRTKEFDYKIEKGDLCYTLFTEKGFEWGGDWTDRKDYQHFEMPSDITEKYSEMYSK